MDSGHDRTCKMKGKKKKEKTFAFELTPCRGTGKIGGVESANVDSFWESFAVAPFKTHFGRISLFN